MGDARARVNPFARLAAPESKKAPPAGGALIAEIAPVYFSFFFAFIFFLWCFVPFFGAT